MAVTDLRDVVVNEAIARAAAPAEPACDHCGLPVPRGRLGVAAAGEFCCSGCEGAWALLHSCGLEQYYRLPERRGVPVEAEARAFEEFDHPSFHALYVRGRRGGLLETDLFLEGVHCASCLWLIERVPRLVPGMAGAELDVPHSRVRVRWDPAATTLSAIARALAGLGYRPHPFRGQRAEVERRAEDRAMIARIGVAGAIAGNVMTLALALYAGWLGDMDAATEGYFRWLSMLLTAPTLVFPGRLFFRGAWSALRARTLHMDVPIAIALGAGFARGAVNTVTGSGPIYFDGVAALVFLLLVGRFLQQRAQRAASDSADLLHALAPATARVVDDSGAREVPVEGLLPGMVVEVRAGESLPADGTVLAGDSALDLSLLSGETRPVRALAGTPVFAGTLNRTATLRVRVERAGEATRLARLLRDVEASAARRAPVVRTADRLSWAFVAVVLALALLTWALWVGRDPSAAIDRAIALLIVTCPCALALATPLAVTVAIGRAARRGILIKGGDALEALARGGRMVLDKTGTLTSGRPALIAWNGPDQVRAWVLALEREATHPVARGFREAWPEVAPAEAEDVRHEIGGGIEGRIAGRRVAVGSAAFVRARASVTRADDMGVAAAGDRGPLGGAADARTPVWVAVDGALVGRAVFGDAIRPEAPAVLEALRRRGWRLELLSGDEPAVVAEVGAALGFAPREIRGGATPEDKLRHIEAAAAAGPVVMVGDGVNDAAAMARATAGIGLHGGAEACLAAADVYLAGGGLAGLAELDAGARRTLEVIRRNILFSLAYNVVGAALAIAGIINPLLAAILMPASSLTVVIASWRGLTFDAPKPAAAANAPAPRLAAAEATS